ncbi:MULTISPECIES: hypothetical protein [Paraliobacillus]|uniref:hypothetical protein n=1 Tax=Paraliobacillus TaxID=200903 RepID=UPI000DD4AE70|nr:MULTISPECIES: hypothetical protein [Paraliobacillus]
MMQIFKRWTILIAFSFLLAGCGDNEEQVDLLFFTDIEETEVEKLRTTVQGQLDDSLSQSIDLEVYSPVYERLISEIATHNGDVILVEADMISPAVLDPEGLVELDDIVTDSQTYIATNPKTEEEHVYGITISASEYSSHELVALIPIYSDYAKQAITVLEKLSE